MTRGVPVENYRSRARFLALFGAVVLAGASCAGHSTTQAARHAPANFTSQSEVKYSPKVVVGHKVLPPEPAATRWCAGIAGGWINQRRVPPTNVRRTRRLHANDVDMQLPTADLMSYTEAPTPTTTADTANEPPISGNGPDTTMLSGQYGLPGLDPHFQASLGDPNGNGCFASVDAEFLADAHVEYHWPFQFGYSDDGLTVASLNRRPTGFNVGPVQGEGSFTGSFGDYSVYSGWGLALGAGVTIGGPVRYTNFRTRVFIPAVTKSGLDGVTFHSLRRSAGGLLRQAGVHTQIIQQRLGHASSRTTTDIYGWVPDESEKAAATSLNDMFMQGRPNAAYREHWRGVRVIGNGG